MKVLRETFANGSAQTVGRSALRLVTGMLIDGVFKCQSCLVTKFHKLAVFGAGFAEARKAGRPSI
jgi:hypothetical protein